MPGIIQEPSAEGLTVKELHPTFGAEIEGVDFENLSEAQFAGIKSALAKVLSQRLDFIFHLFSMAGPKLLMSRTTLSC